MTMSPTARQIIAFIDEFIGLDYGFGYSPFFDWLYQRYIKSNRVVRLATAYEIILANIDLDASVVIAGGEAIEGIILQQFTPKCRLRLFGVNEGHYIFCGRGEVVLLPPGQTEHPTKQGAIHIHTEAVDLESIVLPMANNSAEIVIALEVLEHLKFHPLFMMQQFNRVLVDRGRLFLSTPNLNSFNAIKRMLSFESPYVYPPYDAHGKGIIHTKEYALYELMALLEKSGFSLDGLRTFNYPASVNLDYNSRYQAEPLVSEKYINHLEMRVKNPPELDRHLECFLQELGRSENLLGDYIFVSAERSGEAAQAPYFPLYEAEGQDQEVYYGPQWFGDEETLIRYLDTQTPPWMTPASIREMVFHEKERGLPVQQTNTGQDRYDVYTVANWMYYRSSTYYEGIMRSREQEYARFAKEEGGRPGEGTGIYYLNPKPYRLIHRIIVDLSGVERGTRLQFWLPIPIATAAQKPVTAVSLSPDFIFPALFTSLGMIYGAEWVVEQNCLEIENVYDLTVLETRSNFDGFEPVSGTLPLEVVRFLIRPQEYGDQDVSGLAHYIVGDEKNPLMAGRKIYDWMLSELHFGYAPVYKNLWLQHLLEKRFGDCQALVALFVSICQSLGIPARSRTGVLLGFPLGEGSFIVHAWRYLGFGHQWAEFYVNGLGWLPVEFLPLANWKRSITPDNVRDSTFKERQNGLADFYEDYCFGNLDNMHFACSGMISNCSAVFAMNNDLPPGKPIPPECIEATVEIQRQA